jgi:MscS family membrane protein
MSLVQLLKNFLESLTAKKYKKIYDNVIIPNKTLIKFIIPLIFIDALFLILDKPYWLKIIELFLGILIAFTIAILSVKLCQDFFDNYLLGVTLEEKTQINTELLSLGNFLTKATIVLMVIFIFAETHRINVIALVASLGIVGAAIAFASQKILEQLLWSIVLYIDSPFTVGDYIHLPDGTLGKVEGLGWRSSKIRISGKNILAIIPNSNLAQLRIDNLSQAKRGILILNLTFVKDLSDEEKALANQLILTSTGEIMGIDHQLTQVIFKEISSPTGDNKIQAQAIFYVLGAAENSMELRKSLLQIARENIIEKLQRYGMTFSFEEKLVDITQPMNI